MSSSDRGAHLTGFEFVPDVTGAVTTSFEPESVAVAQLPRETASTPRPLDHYRPGPSEEEMRSACRAEFEVEFRLRLAQERNADAQQLRALADAMKSEAAAREERLARQCVRLALDLAERLVRDRIDRDPETIERVVRDAVAQIDHVTDLTAHVHPADADLLRLHGESLREIGIAEIRPDPQQRRGGCRLECDERSWDASLVGQLARLSDALEEVLESAS
jgi:flagellar biosynthesis/type III secretory pathway protein FliH